MRKNVNCRPYFMIGDIMEENENRIEETRDETIWFAEPLLVSQEKLFTLTEFTDGLKIGAEYAGMISALISSGIEYYDAVGIACTIINRDMNITMNKQNAEATIESSKNANVVADKMQV